MDPDKGIFLNSCKIGGGERDRTDDPLLAKQVLSQLSYAPANSFELKNTRTIRFIVLISLEQIRDKKGSIGRS